MKATLHISIAIFFLFLLAGCDEDQKILSEFQEEPGQESTDDKTSTNIPEGYFEVTFSSGNDKTRAPVTGEDGRVRHLRYILYNSTGDFVKEKVVLTTTDATPTWPLAAVKDTLPKGTYTAVFMANLDKSLFPIPAAGNTTTYAEVLTNYKGKFSDARIVMPNVEFTNTSEYYWAKVPFSDTSSQPNVILQRVISTLNLHRNFVDTQHALDTLVHNVVVQMHYQDSIWVNVQKLLPGLLRPALNLGVGNTIYILIGGLDGAVNLVTAGLIPQITDALYKMLLKELVNQIGLALTGNATQTGALAGLGVLLNPWAQNEAHTAIVTIRDFPKTMDFNLTVKDYYTGDQRFKYAFTGGTVYDEKDILIKGFNGLFNVRKINVVKQGLVSGLLVDQVIDGPLLLNGTFIDINDPIQATVAANVRYQADYSFLDLRLKSNAQSANSITLQIQLKNIANLDGILTAIPGVGDLLSGAVKLLVGNITVSVPIKLPVLGGSNLELSGSWSPVTTY